MVGSFITMIATRVGLGWLMRRIPDWGGQLLMWLGGLLTLFTQLDPVTQAVVLSVLQGRWQEITLGSAIGAVVFVIAQWRSWRATVKPQVVTREGTKIEVPVMTEAQARQAVYEATGRYPTEPVERR